MPKPERKPARDSKPQAGFKRKADGAPPGNGAKQARIPGKQDAGRPAPGGGRKPSQAAQPPPGPVSRKDRKAAVQDKKLKMKKNYPLILEAIQMWEKLRPKEVGKEEKAAIAAQLMARLRGKLLELSSHHAASRVIQFCAKHGSEAHRAEIMAQVRANIVALSRSKFGHHLVRKLINVAKREEVPALVKLFKGHCVALLRHPQGADVLTDLYDVASGPQRNAMCAEFYGKEYALFDGVVASGAGLATLGQLMAAPGVNPAKRRAIVQRFSRGLMPILEKAILHPPMVHRLLREFLLNAPGMSIEDAVDTLSDTGPAVLKMVHTHDGAAAVAMLLAYGSAKQRKKLVRSMKGYVRDMALNEWGHAVVCAALSSVDDTALLTKVAVKELQACLDELVDSPHGHRILLQLLSPYNKRYQPPAVMELLQPPQRTVRGVAADAESDGEEDGEEAGSGDGSKRGGKKRRAQQPEAEEEGEEDGEGGKLAEGEKDEEEEEEEDADEEEEEEADEDEEEGIDAEAADDAGEEDEAAAGSSGQAGPERVLGLSKKDPVARRQELLCAGEAKAPQGKAQAAGGSGSLAQQLTALCAARAGELLRSRNGHDVITEVARGGDGGLLYRVCREGVEAVHAAIVAEAAAARPGAATAPEAEEEEENEAGPSRPMEHVVLDYYGSRALRRILLASGEQGAGGEAATAFASALWSGAFSGRCKAWVGSHGDKVLAAFVQCGDAAVRAAATKQLQPLLKQPAGQWCKAFLGPQQKSEQQSDAKQQRPASTVAPGKAAAGSDDQAAGAAADASPAVTRSGKQQPAPSQSARTSRQGRSKQVAPAPDAGAADVEPAEKVASGARAPRAAAASKGSSKSAAAVPDGGGQQGKTKKQKK